MLIPSIRTIGRTSEPSLSRRVNANSQPVGDEDVRVGKLIKKGEC